MPWTPTIFLRFADEAEFLASIPSVWINPDAPDAANIVPDWWASVDVIGQTDDGFLVNMKLDTSYEIPEAMQTHVIPRPEDPIRDFARKG